LHFIVKKRDDSGCIKLPTLVETIQIKNKEHFELFDRFRTPIAQHAKLARDTMEYLSIVPQLTSHFGTIRLDLGSDALSLTNSLYSFEFLGLDGLTEAIFSGRALDTVLMQVLMQEFGTQNHIQNNYRQTGAEADYTRVFDLACQNFMIKLGMMHPTLAYPIPVFNPGELEPLQAYLDSIKFQTAYITGFNFVRYFVEAFNSDIFSQTQISPLSIGGKIDMTSKLSTSPVSPEESARHKHYVIDASNGLTDARLIWIKDSTTLQEACQCLGKDFSPYEHHLTFLEHPSTYELEVIDLNFDKVRYLKWIQGIIPQLPVDYLIGLKPNSTVLSVASAVSLLEADYTNAIAELKEAYRQKTDNIDDLLDAIHHLHPVVARRQGCSRRYAPNPFVAFPSDPENLLMRRIAHVLYYEMGQKEQAISLLEKSEERGTIDGDNYLQLALFCAGESRNGNTQHQPKIHKYLGLGIQKSPNPFNVELTLLQLRYYAERLPQSPDTQLPVDFFEFIGKEVQRQKLDENQDTRYYHVLTCLYLSLAKYHERILHHFRDVMHPLEVSEYKADIQMCKEHAWTTLTYTDYHCTPGRIPLAKEGSVFFIDHPEVVGLGEVTHSLAFKDSQIDQFLVARAVLHYLGEETCNAYLSMFQGASGENLILMNKAGTTLDQLLKSQAPLKEKQRATESFLNIQEDVQARLTPELREADGYCLLSPIEDSWQPVKIPQIDFRALRDKSTFSHDKKDDTKPRLASVDECCQGGDYLYTNPAINGFRLASDEFLGWYMEFGMVQDTRTRKKLQAFVWSFNNLDTKPSNCLIANIDGQEHIQIADWDQFGIAPCVYSYAFTLADPDVNHYVFNGIAYSKHEQRMVQRVLKKRAESIGTHLSRLEMGHLEKAYRAAKAWRCVRSIYGMQSRLNDSDTAEKLLVKFVDYSTAIEPHILLRPRRAEEPMYRGLHISTANLYSFVNAVMQTEEHQNLHFALLRHHPQIVWNSVSHADQGTREKIMDRYGKYIDPQSRADLEIPIVRCI